MNRRSFLSWLAAAPVAVAVTQAAEADTMAEWQAYFGVDFGTSPPFVMISAKRPAPQPPLA